ncbi:MAG: DUF6159 family protein [Bacteroidota bacterium]
MNVFDRLSKGWNLGLMSLDVIKENPKLMLFPAFSGLAMLFLSLSFLGSSWLFFGEGIFDVLDENATAVASEKIGYAFLFIFYLCNYFIVIFFNIGLVHCVGKVMDGEEMTISDGIEYARSRTTTILTWAALAATVGMVLNTIQERAGALGGIITSLIGMAWNITTFFVVPVLAYEDVTPIEAIKRSGQIVKEKWGESLGSGISFSLFTMLGIFLLVIPSGFLTGYLIHPAIGIITGVIAFMLVMIGVSAGKMVFLTAAYRHATAQEARGFDVSAMEHVFVQK